MSTTAPAPKSTSATKAQRAVRVGRVDICVVGDTVTLRLWERPGVASKVSAVQLERWALRQLREGVFA